MPRTKLLSGFLLALLLASSLGVFASAQNNGTNVFVDPALVERFTPPTKVGDTFQVTIKVSDVFELFAFQFKVIYDNSLLKATVGELPALNDPNYILYGRSTIRPAPSYGSNYVLVGDTILVGDTASGSGLLGMVTFEIIQVPAEGSLSSILEIDNADTYLLDYDLEEMETAKTNGNYQVTAEVVPNKPPVPEFFFAPSTPTVDDSVLFDASASSDPDGTIISYQWDFGDGATGSGKIVAHAYATAGTFTVTLTVTDDDAATAQAASLVSVAPTPPMDTVLVTVCPEFSSGEYPEWKQFTITNVGMDRIVKITIVLPQTDPMLEPVEFEFDVKPKGVCPGPHGWLVTYNEMDREILIESSDPKNIFVPQKCSGILNVKFDEGPSNCLQPIEFHITIIDLSCHTVRVKRFEYIDKERPIVNITFPGPESLTQDPNKDYVYVKKSDGTIWVQKPDGTQEKINWLWLEGTVQDKNTSSCPYASGVNRVEIWIWFSPETYDNPNDKVRYPNGVWVYMGDGEIDPPYIHVPCSKPIDQAGLFDNQKLRKWTWRTDPTTEPHYKAHGTDVWVHWTSEVWYKAKAMAFDNAVNNIGYWEINQEYKDPYRPPTQRKTLITNNAQTSEHWFFWMVQNVPLIRIPPWVPGNGVICISGVTGFNPGSSVSVRLWDKFYNYNYNPWTTVKADANGRFILKIRLPELPRHPHDMSDDRMFYYITATDTYQNTWTERFILIPWITYENALSESNIDAWKTTKVGSVFDTINVYGHGFLPSKKTGYDPYSTVWAHVIYTDVAPLESWDTRTVWNGSGHTMCLGVDELTWTPRLGEVILKDVQTDPNGYWTAQVQIPQSYGGFHAIYGWEYKVITEINRPGPGVPQGDTKYDLVKSGWPEVTNLWEEQAVIFDVWPTIAISPSTALTDQYVTITGEGLPLPKYYKLWKNDKPVVASRDWCLVMDFGPYEQWVFENKRIRNNDLDLAWAVGAWFPLAFYSPDIGVHQESPVWKGKLSSVTMDYANGETQFHIGSKYLKVPILPAGEYQVMVYYFAKETIDDLKLIEESGSFVHDHHAVTSVTVLKDPLHINAEVGKIHFPGEIVNVLAQVDVDGIATDATALTLALYKGEALVENLNLKRINIGSYIGKFICPQGEGDYFIKASASKEYEMFSLHGSAIASFTVNPTLNGLEAKLINIENKVAQLETKIGTISLDLAAVNAKIVAIEGNVATIQTDIGTLQTDMENINGEITAIEGTVATIQTDIGTLKIDIGNINGKVVAVDGKMATIQTDIGTLQTDIETINGKVVAIDGKVATIQTGVGTVQTSVEKINGVITGLHNDVVSVHTDVGDLEVKLKEINGLVIIEKDVATIKTELGEIKGKVDSLEGDTATIKTNIGTITTKADLIQGNVGLQPVTIGLSLIAAIAAIAAAGLILRKVYLK